MRLLRVEIVDDEVVLCAGLRDFHLTPGEAKEVAEYLNDAAEIILGEA